MKRPDRTRFLSAALGGAALAVFSLTAQQAMADETLIVRDFTLTHGIAGREPTDKVAAYANYDDQAFAFARINNTGAPTQVQFRWYYNNEHHATVPLTVGSSSAWRTWSSANLRPGNWRVQLVDSDGDVLMTRAFRVGTNTGPAMAQRSIEASPMADVKPASGRSDNQRYPSFGTSGNPSGNPYR